jgi:hypothetical protein
VTTIGNFACIILRAGLVDGAIAVPAMTNAARAGTAA